MAHAPTTSRCSACIPGAPPAPPRTLFPTFVFTALALAVTLGVSTGGWAIWRMAFASGTVLASHLQLHAHVQLLGFAGLLILGVALHALPRILGVPPPSRRVLFTVLVGVGGGALLRAIGQPLAPWAAGRFLSLLSGALELVGIFAFASWALPVLGARRASSDDPLSLHVFLGTIWAVLAALLSGMQSLFLAGHAESEIPGSLVEPFYAVALYGLILSFVFGFASRMVPAFLGLPRPSGKSARPVAALQAAGVLLLAAAWIPGFLPASRGLTLVGTLLLVAAVLLFLAASRILLPFAKAPGALSLRAPFAFLGLFAAISVAACVGELSGAAVHKFVWDGARHVFTIGFLTLLILGMSLRIVPAFTGRTLARPREARLALALVFAAAVVRALQIPVALGLGGLPLYRLVGTTGIFATAGFLLWAHVLIATLRPRPARPPFAPATSLPVRTARASFGASLSSISP
ncbi:MAG: NnrS family protein [Thermoanaerobaculia bacterium]